MYRVTVTKSQLLRLKHHVLSDMNLYDFEPQKKQVVFCEKIVEALEQAKDGQVELAKPQLLYLKQCVLDWMNSAGYDGDYPEFRAHSELLDALERAHK
jgi:hypothetical protein